MRYMRFFLFIPALLVLLTACKREDAPTYPDSSLGLIQEHILEKSCAVSGCHDATSGSVSAQHHLILTGDGLYAALVNAPVANAQAVTADLRQIVPNDTTRSFLYQKVIFDRAQHAYGGIMPMGMDPLSANQIAFLKQWIMAGAPETGHVADKTLLQ
jgi:hypothetical protein